MTRQAQGWSSLLLFACFQACALMGVVVKSTAAEELAWPRPYSPEELIASWGYPLEIEIWIDNQRVADDHAYYYNYRTAHQNFDRAFVDPLPVPYSAGSILVLEDHRIQDELFEHTVASTDSIRYDLGLSDDGIAHLSVDWEDFGWRALPEESVRQAHPLFPLAVICRLLEDTHEHYRLVVNGQHLDAEELDRLLGRETAPEELLYGPSVIIELRRSKE